MSGRILALDKTIERKTVLSECDKGENILDTDKFIRTMNAGEYVVAGSEIHEHMVKLTFEAMKITSCLNQGYHEPEEIREMFFKLTGSEMDQTFGLFPPFYTDCGKNIHVGKHVFINSGCHFQDQGGIYIGDGTLVGHCVTLATLNHDQNPENRANLLPAPIHIGKNVWIGANVTVTPGVTIGDGSIIAAGAVVTRDIPENVVAGGIPATVIKKIICKK